VNWSAAVTAAPRKGTFYLADAIESIAAAGWPDGVVYADPGTPDCRWPMDYAERSVGPWPQFQRALRGCLESPCDAVAVFQDDCLVARGCREWLEAELAQWPWPDTGVVSLYTSEQIAKNFGPSRGWFCLPEKSMPRKAYGAVAIAIMRGRAEDLAKLFPRPDGRTKTDYHVACWCKDRGLRWAHHSPSLVRHVGVVSAVYTRRGNRKWMQYRHEGEFVEDCRELAENREVCCETRKR